MKFNTKTITLTTEAHGNKIKTEKRAIALAVLLGEYNKFGRKASIIEVEKLRLELETIIYKMQDLLV